MPRKKIVKDAISDKLQNNIIKDEKIIKLQAKCQIENTIIKKIIFWLFGGLIFLLPLFFLPIGTEILEFNKQSLLLIIASAIACLYLVDVVINKKAHIKLNAIYFGVIATLLASIGATIFSAYPLKSLIGFENQEYSSLITLISLIVVSFIAANIFDWQRWQKLLFVFLISTTISTVFGLLQLCNIFILPFDFAKTNSFNTIGFFSLWLSLVAVNLIIALVYILKANEKFDFKKNWLQLTWPTVIAIIDLATLIIVNDWRAWISLIITLVAATIILFIKTEKEKRINWIILPSIIIVLAGIMFFIKPTSKINSPVEPFKAEQALSMSWQIAKQSLIQNPLFGFGAGNYVIGYTKFHDKNINQTIYWNTKLDRLGSDFFTRLATFGMMGLLALIILIVILKIKTYKYFLKTKFDDSFLVFISYLLVLTFIMTNSFINVSNITTTSLMWLVLAPIIYFTSVKEKNIALTSQKNNLIAIILLCIISIVGVGKLYLVINRYIAETNYAYGLETDKKLASQTNLDINTQKQSLDTMINAFKKAAETVKDQDTYSRSLAQSYNYKIISLSNNNQLSNEDVQAMQVAAQQAVEVGKKALMANPQDSRNALTLAMVYQTILPISQNADKFSIDNLNKAINLEPYNPSYYYELANTQLTTANINSKKIDSEKEKSKQQEISIAVTDLQNQAQKNYEKAADLKTDYAPAYYQLGLMALSKKDNQKAVQMLEEAYKYNSYDANINYQLAMVYKSFGQTDKALTMMEKTYSLTKNNQQVITNIVELYVASSQKDKAITVLQEALKTNPTNEELQKQLSNLTTPTSIKKETATPALPKNLPTTPPEKELKKKTK